MRQWRLIHDGPRDAAFNMAADSFLLDQAEIDVDVPILRLYRWEKPSITIGFHQDIDHAVDMAALGDTPVVPRATGGRALLHDDRELTYAVAGNFISCPELGASLRDSYDLIARAILAFYHALGWAALMARRETPVPLARRHSVQSGCFASVSRHEITAWGQKAAAGSQRRTRTAFMQHGAVKIAPPVHHPAIRETLPEIGADAFPALTESRETLETIMIESFQKELGIGFREEPFSYTEIAEIEKNIERFKNLNERIF